MNLHTWRWEHWAAACKTTATEHSLSPQRKPNDSPDQALSLLGFLVPDTPPLSRVHAQEASLPFPPLSTPPGEILRTSHVVCRAEAEVARFPHSMASPGHGRHDGSSGPALTRDSGRGSRETLWPPARSNSGCRLSRKAGPRLSCSPSDLRKWSHRKQRLKL